MATAVEFDNVSIVFGAKPELALPMMDEMKERSEIQVKTGQVLGVHDCSLTVGTGEILVLMGLSGSGKSTLIRAVNALNPVVRGDRAGQQRFRNGRRHPRGREDPARPASAQDRDGLSAIRPLAVAHGSRKRRSRTRVERHVEGGAQCKGRRATRARPP